MNKSKLLILICILGLFLSFTGCSNNKYSNYYDIYYANQDFYELVTLKHGTNETDPEKLIQELFQEMNTPQKSDHYTVIKKETVNLQKYSIKNNIAYLYFDKSYYDMDAARQAFFRNALVNTITQIKSIDYVTIYVDDMPATYADGSLIGMLNRTDFVSEEDNNVSNLQHEDLTLYFANVKGDKLLKNKVNVAYSKNVSIERAIVEQLINGPGATSGYARSLPEGLKLLNISVKDGICFVNLDSTFLTQIVNVSGNVPIYSIVNSLCELDYIDKVQILIDGDAKKVYRESISLDTQFEKNNDIVDN